MTSCSGSLMTNYARIGHAAQQVFPDILQVIIAIKEPQHCLYGDVTSHRYLTRNLRADEWSMINNVRTNGYVNFDIPLIYKLVRNLNLVPPPSMGWDFHTPPAANEILPGDDIERIRRTRNEILHRGNAQVSDLSLTDFFRFQRHCYSIGNFSWEAKREFLYKFQDLETCCIDEDTEKTYLDRLAILRERDTNLSEAVANMRKDLDTIMYKDSHQIVIEEWEEQNKLFIKTDAVDFILESLKEKNCCTVIGISGIGKSATIHHVALFLRDTEGYRIIPIHSPSEIDKYFQRNRKQIFVIDDICGKYTVIQTEVEKWIKRNDSIQRVLNCNNIKVIASSRIQVFNEKQFKRLQLFTQRFCNLSSDIYCLSSQVKLQIARQYLPQAAVEQIENDLDKYEFLPLMFALYKSLCKGKEHFDAVQFFKNPFNIYTEEIDALYELLDQTKFCALFFLVIYNGYFDVSFFTKDESEQERQTREDFVEDCGIPRNTLRQRILEQLKSLVPLFVRSNNDLSGQVISFSAIHDKTFDFLCYYFGNRFQQSFLRFADSEMLNERTMLKSLVSTDEDVEEFTILIDDFNEDRYFKRIVDQWSSGKLASLFYSRQMNYETYRNKLINFLNRLPKEKCKEMMTIEIDKEVVQFNFIDDSCSGLLPVSPLSLSFKRNFSDLVKYILDFINDTKGFSDVVRILIDKGSNIDFRDTNGWTPSMAACEHGHKSIVELLLKSEANVRQADNYGWTPFMRACGKGHADVVKILIENGIKINQKDKYGQTPFMLAIENGHHNIVELLSMKITKHEIDNKARSPLIFACDNGWTNIVELLINREADVNIVDIYGMTPLLAAANHGYKQIVMILLASGSIVYNICKNISILIKWAFQDGNEDVIKILTNCRDESEGSKCGWIPLIAATIDKQDTLVKLLISQGANVNISDTDEKEADVNLSNIVGESPLILECYKDNSDIIRLLIEKGADVNVSNKDGETPLILACNKDNTDIIRLLIEKGANVNVSNDVGDNPLILECHKNNTDTISLLIEKELTLIKGADVNVPKYDGDNPLILACNKDNTDIIRLLIEKGANVNVSDEDGDTPLILACNKDNTDIIRLLIEKGANVNVSDKDGDTPLILACDKDNTDIIRLIIEKGADVNVSNDVGHTLLIWACCNENSDIIRLLIEKGADVNVSDMSGDNPLILAYNIDIVRLLIEKGADINVSNEEGKTPLILACDKDNTDIIRLLIEKGADVNVSNEDGETPLILACNNDNSDIVRLLIEKGADINVSDKVEDTPLILACYNDNSDIIRLLIEKKADVNDNSDIVRLLIEKGADVNVSDKREETPLIWSCKHDNSDIVRLLLEKGAEINLCDIDGMTALLYASKSGFFEIVEELTMNGADVLLAAKNGKTSLMFAIENNDRRIENFLSKHLYKSKIFDNNRKRSINQTGDEVIYERATKIMRVDEAIHIKKQ
ncbi:Putative ankyrin repeat protein MM_0045 [Mytilus edulis]|uniref:Ankyrin repeat protein MM_0045 n=1 Tax=Mytilus edulis TaxID=6550 RepID=A0A8S3UYP8_MYTED|nr:Putative ankyrin repeat protein MM_0045 [Mytilus edulis]